jgi:hypothetical protein
METVVWDSKGVLTMYEVIYATRDHSNVRNVMRDTKITTEGHSEQKAWNTDIRCSAPP